MQFYFATPEARDWYDPIKPYAMLEYEWVVRNMPLKGQRVIDAGAHHGQYTVLFGLASERTAQITAVDPVRQNCGIVEVNCCLNRVKADVLECAVSDQVGPVRFRNATNGHIVAPTTSDGCVTVQSRLLCGLVPDPTVVKLDVEGAEFYILPDQLHRMPTVKHWIIEVHPSARRDPHKLMRLLLDREFDLHWVNRAAMRVEPYPHGTADWSTHTTVFAQAS